MYFAMFIFIDKFYFYGILRCLHNKVTAAQCGLRSKSLVENSDRNPVHATV